RGDRRDRGQVLCRARRAPEAPQPAATARALALAGDAAAIHRDLQVEAARGVVPDLRRRRCMLCPGALLVGSTHASACDGAFRLHERGQRRAAGARAALLPQRHKRAAAAAGARPGRTAGTRRLGLRFERGEAARIARPRNKGLKMLGRLMPREGKFFDLFNAHGERIVEGSKELAAMIGTFSELDAHARRIDEAERAADKITHECISLLHTTFITPFDREQIHSLITSMDDILDLIQDVAESIALYDLRSVTPEAKQLA